MKKNLIRVVILLILLITLSLNACKKKHVHNYINGVCECGEIDDNAEKDLELLSFNALENIEDEHKLLSAKKKKYDISEMDICIDPVENKLYLEARVKNQKRDSFIDMVLYISYLDTNVVFNEGHGEYICSSTTVFEDNLWVTVIKIELSLEECKEKYAEVVVTEINFLHNGNTNMKAFLNSKAKNNVKFHVHDYKEKIEDDKYFKENANHLFGDQYYYSCECGAIGSETFDVGETIPHVFNLQVVEQKFLKEKANCTHGDIYYYSCECGTPGTKTFEYGKVNHTANWKYNSDETEYSCGTKSGICYDCGESITVEVEGKGGTPTLTYELVNDYYIVTGCTDTEKRTTIIIPREYEGKVVKGIKENAFHNCFYEQPIKLIIPDTVMTIGAHAFEANKIKELIIPDSVVEIGRNAFYGCTAEYLQISNKLTKIEDGALFIEVKDFIMPDSVTEIGEHSVCFTETIKISSNLKIIPDRAISCGTKDKVDFVKIPSSVESIGIYNFWSARLLYIPSSVKEIKIAEGSGLPYKIYTEYKEWSTSICEAHDVRTGISPNSIHIHNNCLYLLDEETKTAELTTVFDSKEIIIPEKIDIDGKEYIVCGTLGRLGNLVKVEKVDIQSPNVKLTERIFSYAENLKEVNLVEGIKDIPEQAFSNCSNLVKINLPESLENIGNSAFYGCSSLDNIVLPKNVLAIGDSAFSGCNISEITLPEGITKIAGGLFTGCTRLKNIKIPDGVTYIGINAFSLCSSLTNVVIPDGVTVINTNAFHSCTSLNEIVIPDSVIEIGTRAFYSCTSLNEIVIPDSVAIMGWNAFKNCYNLEIYCEALSQPEGWEDEWNSSNLPVYWGVNKD